MDDTRLREILDGFAATRVLVVGDFFLDQYLVLDAELTETSIETALDAYQVVEKRLFPGAAGTVTSNLKALGAGTVSALGAIGVDGEGFELKRGLQQTGVDTGLLIETEERFTSTYTKPVLRECDVERELNRIDIKNRSALPRKTEKRIVSFLREVARQVDAVVVADQVQERNCGVITDTVREELSRLSQQCREVVFIVDSRVRIGEYTSMWIKPNQREAFSAAHDTEADSVTMKETAAVGLDLVKRNGRPVFVTLAEDGILAVTANAVHHVPTLRQTGTIDIVGAGDSVMAGITLALCSGATPEEAAVVGNLVASITVQQIGVTGTATRQEVLQRFRATHEQFQPLSLNH